MSKTPYYYKPVQIPSTSQTEAVKASIHMQLIIPESMPAPTAGRTGDPLLVLLVLRQKLLQWSPVHSCNVPEPALVGPANTVGEVFVTLLNEYACCRVVISRGDFMTVRDEWFERDDFATFFEIEEEGEEYIVQLRREGLVVDEDNVGFAKNFADLGVLGEVAPE